MKVWWKVKRGEKLNTVASFDKRRLAKYYYSKIPDSEPAQLWASKWEDKEGRATKKLIAENNV